ncbi:hypothetical protein [Streptomyces carpinensis]|uniref:Uncharacterized protein n=1 Tax=Streptomyces carpinensis TaxID=66369 RepID=A0ABV1WHH3_9ACTN|nr:hypothetical protein [Streptomyces carpinensis]
MSRNDSGRRREHPDTATGEILHEIENAETDVDDSRERRHRGEAAETITPNERAQEEAQGEAEAHGEAERN